MKLFSILLIVCFVFAGVASASLIPFLASGPTSSGISANPFQYSYSVTLSSDERLDPTATSGSTCNGAPCVPPGTFWTLYDIPGGGFPGNAPQVVSTAAGWSGSVQFTGITPGGILPPDSGVIYNISFFYNGPVVNGTGQTFTGFVIDSTGDILSPLGSFSYQATKNSADASNGTTDNGKGNVLVPASSVPEPSSMLLIGGGLVGLALFRRKFIH